MRALLSRSVSGGAAMLLALASTGLLVGCVGPEGPEGPAGQVGVDGKDGIDGEDGEDGLDGKDAIVDSSLSPIEKAFVFAGGKEAVAGINATKVELEGIRWVVGEGYLPDSAPLSTGTFQLTASEDLTADNLRLDYKRNITFLGMTVDTEFSEIFQGQLGFVSGAEGLFGQPEVGNMPSDRWGASRRQHQLLNPHLLLRAAALDPSIVHDSGAEVLDGILYRKVTLDDAVAPITLFVSDATGRIEKLSTLDNNYVMRDVPVEVFFTGWKVNGQQISYPGEVFVSYDGFIIHQDKRTGFEANPTIAAGTFEFPAGASPMFDADEAERGAASHQFHEMFEAVGIALDGPQNLTNPIPIAPGVVQLQGGTHNVGIIEQQDGLVMLDAPIHELRSKAVLAWVAQNYPTKPIKHVIVTHFHEDHAGGVREIAATGADVIVGEATAKHFGRALSAASTVYPDTLSQNPKEVKLIAVPQNGSYTIADGLRPVTAYAFESFHAADMLMIYEPLSKAVWATDIFSAATPPGSGGLFAAAAMQLHHAIVDVHNIDVQLLFTGHGFGSNTFGEFETLLGIAP